MQKTVHVHLKKRARLGLKRPNSKERTRACVDESQHPGSKNLHNIWLELELTRVAGTPHPRTVNLCGLRIAVRTDTARLTPSTFHCNSRERDCELFVCGGRVATEIYQRHKNSLTLRASSFIATDARKPSSSTATISPGRCHGRRVWSREFSTRSKPT